MLELLCKKEYIHGYLSQKQNNICTKVQRNIDIEQFSVEKMFLL